MSLKSLVPFWKSTPSALNKKRPFLSLHNEVNRLFEDFFRDRLPLNEMEDELLVPNIDVIEHEKQYEIAAELPGFEDKDVELSVVEGELVIYASKKIEKTERKKDYHLSECTQGSFCRSIPLPYDADANTINAQMKSGILRIEISKVAGSSEKVKKIPIKGG